MAAAFFYCSREDFVCPSGKLIKFYELFSLLLLMFVSVQVCLRDVLIKLIWVTKNTDCFFLQFDVNLKKKISSFVKIKLVINYQMQNTVKQNFEVCQPDKNNISWETVTVIL